LRHDPAALGITLDRAGFTDLTSLLAALSTHGVTLAASPNLEELIRSSDKQRFALTADRTRIRANHGHSVDVDLGLVPEAPPERLYHGTVRRFLDRICREGLIAGGFLPETHTRCVCRFARPVRLRASLETRGTQSPVLGPR
jgi:putative RNA 2'-phosphotransferase